MIKFNFTSHWKISRARFFTLFVVVNIFAGIIFFSIFTQPKYSSRVQVTTYDVPNVSWVLEAQPERRFVPVVTLDVINKRFLVPFRKVGTASTPDYPHNAVKDCAKRVQFDNLESINENHLLVTFSSESQVCLETVNQAFISFLRFQEQRTLDEIKSLRTVFAKVKTRRDVRRPAPQSDSNNFYRFDTFRLEVFLSETLNESSQVGTEVVLSERGLIRYRPPAALLFGFILFQLSSFILHRYIRQFTKEG
jgi:hypothetical protein